MASKFLKHISIIFVLTTFSSVFSSEPPERDLYWPQWRGPRMDGVAPYGDPPIEWSEEQNIAWKLNIPGLGASTPIIWRDVIFLQSAEPVGEASESNQNLKEWQKKGRPVFQGESYQLSRKRQRFMLIAVDRRTGKPLWQKALHEEQPHEGIHPTNTWASGSPVTDGEHIVSYFGSWGLFVLDMKGNVMWQKDLGDMDTRNGWGEGSSPTLYENKIVVNWDHEGQSFIAAFDKKSGKELWRQQRDEVTSWFTPLVVVVDGTPQIVTTGAGHVRGYDLETGEVIWTGPGLTVNAIPTPVTANGKVYLTSGYRGNILLAIELIKAKGALEQTNAIAWRYDKDTPYVSSPLLYENQLYFFKHFQNILTSMDVESGQPVYGPLRLTDLRMVYASPVAACGRIYFVDRSGTAVVISHGAQPEIMAVNTLDDGFDASPAIVGKEIYLRGQGFFYKIAEK